ncbi:MAG: metallophosphoesterase, partial [Clostridia bacterium]|nr:metallophosphoesterase [Clostridia bacterium]
MKKLMALLLMLAMVLPMLAVFSPLGASAAADAVYDKPSHTAATDGSKGLDIEDSDGDGFADDYYYAKKKLERTPQTFQAWVYIPSDYSTRLNGTGRDNLGAILSNSNALNDTHGVQFLFYVTSSLAPAFLYYDDVLTPYDVRFDRCKLPVAQWTMVTIVWDNESGYVSCYLNGELGDRQGFLPAIDPRIADQPLALGGSYGSVYAKKEDQKNFLCKLQDVSVYATARTAEQVKSDYVNGVNVNDDELICHYDIDAAAMHADLADATGNGHTLIYSKKWLTEADMKKIRENYAFEPAFSFAAIGDTQKTMYREGFTNGYRVNASKQITTNSGTPTKSIIYNMYKWMADNKTAKNLQLVMGLGDITDANLSVEWEIAAASTRLLGAAGIPYTMMRGNHDSATGKHSNSYGAYTGMGDSSIDTYYGKNGTIDEYYYSQFTDPAKGGMYNNSVRNVYRIVEVGETKWMVITLDFRADDNVLAWAGDLCKTHPDHNVIITTHIYLDYEGKPISYGDLSDSPNNGDDKWNELASKHENIKLVLSGHIGSDTIAVSQVKGDAGNTVTQMMIDPQGSDGLAGGLGIVAMFYFNEDGTEFYTEFYSVEKNAYLLNYNQFHVDLEAEGAEQQATQTEIHYGSKPAGSGTQSDPYRISTVEHLAWMASTVNRNNSSVQFKNTYFVQTCDIDLQGNTIKSIGGYFKNPSGSSLQAKAFGGHYDGCGFTIKNGMLSAAQPDKYFNKRKQNGLFGCIYGATIKNVVLEDMVIAGRGPTGAIVGKAMAPWDGSAEVGFNKIIGCHVGEGVELRTWHPNMVTDDIYDNETRAGVVGGICGIAYATEIRGCTVENTMTVTGYFGIVGGIAGTAGYNTVIDHCAFTGGIELADTRTYRSNSIGGIVGMISPFSSTSPDQDYTTPMAGILHITNCYNGGTYDYTGDVDLNTVDVEKGYNVNEKNVHWGGIIGHAGGMLDVVPTAEIPYPFLIENCYNLHNEQRNAYEQNIERYYVGGLIGRSFATPSRSSVLYFRNCYSVKVDGAGGPTVKKDGVTVYADYT